MSNLQLQPRSIFVHYELCPIPQSFQQKVLKALKYISLNMSFSIKCDTLLDIQQAYSVFPANQCNDIQRRLQALHLYDALYDRLKLIFAKGYGDYIMSVASCLFVSPCSPVVVLYQCLFNMVRQGISLHRI